MCDINNYGPSPEVWWLSLGQVCPTQLFILRWWVMSSWITWHQVCLYMTWFLHHMFPWIQVCGCLHRPRAQAVSSKFRVGVCGAPLPPVGFSPLSHCGILMIMGGGGLPEMEDPWEDPWNDFGVGLGLISVIVNPEGYPHCDYLLKFPVCYPPEITQVGSTLWGTMRVVVTGYNKWG